MYEHFIAPGYCFSMAASCAPAVPLSDTVLVADRPYARTDSNKHSVA